MSLDNVRVKVTKKYHPVYRALTRDTATRHKIFEQHSDLFTFCAVLGHRMGRSNPVRSEGFFFANALDAHQQTTITAIALASHGGYEILTRPAEVVQIAEGYADVGMELLLSDILSDYRREDEDGNVTLNFGDVHQLEKIVLGYVQDQKNRDPFS